MKRKVTKIQVNTEMRLFSSRKFTLAIRNNIVDTRMFVIIQGTNAVGTLEYGKKQNPGSAPAWPTFSFGSLHCSYRSSWQSAVGA